MKKNRTKGPDFGYSPEEYRKFKKHGWRLLLIYSLYYCMLYCTRLNLSNAAPKMMEELSFTTADIGILTATLFWAYAIGMLIGGRLGEMIGPRKFILISTIVTVGANICMAFTSSLPLMIVLWAVNGLAQSMNWPAGCIIINNWWPGESRGFAVGLASAFSGFGQAMAMLVVALAFILFPEAGWRSAFFVPAILPAAFYLLYALTTKASPENVGLKQYKEENQALAEEEAVMQEKVKKNGRFFPYRFLLSNVSFDLILFMHIFIGVARYGLLTWIPLYFIDRFDVDIMEGIFTSLMLPIGMGIGSLVMPTISDHMKDRMKLLPFITVFAVASVLLLLLPDPRTAGGFILIELLLFMAGFMIYAAAGLLNVVVCDYGGRVFAGTANGLFGFTGYLGAGVQAVIYGAIVEKAGWNMIFISIGVFLILIAGLSLIKKTQKKEMSKS